MKNGSKGSSKMSGEDSKTTEQEAPKFVFGQGSALGSGAGFGALAAGTEGGAAQFGGANEDDAGNEEYKEEECQAEFQPVVQLQEVETKTGEEDEEAKFEQKCKLYRYDTDANEWKERGLGMAKILKHKESRKSRMLMRQDKTLKIRANHIIMPGTELQEHAAQANTWVYRTMDFADEELKPEMFCIRFGSEEKAEAFKAAFEKAAEENAAALGIKGGESKAEEGAKEGETKKDEAEELAGKLEGAKVADDGESKDE